MINKRICPYEESRLRIVAIHYTELDTFVKLVHAISISDSNIYF